MPNFVPKKKGIQAYCTADLPDGYCWQCHRCAPCDRMSWANACLPRDGVRICTDSGGCFNSRHYRRVDARCGQAVGAGRRSSLLLRAAVLAGKPVVPAGFTGGQV